MAFKWCSIQCQRKYKNNTIFWENNGKGTAENYDIEFEKEL